MNKKIGCLFLEITHGDLTNYKGNNFFSYNAINSFKQWNPEVDVIHITNQNFNSYLQELNITEYYDELALILLKLIEKLMLIKGYSKIIRLGVDTLTCSRLDEFLDNDEPDVIFSSGPPYSFLQTKYWKPKTEVFEYEGNSYQDVSFINADVTCINNSKMATLLHDITFQYWTEHQDQGGMNYCYINQKELGINAKIVDFPYVKTKVLYNVRSKGVACGGNQMYRGQVWSGNYKDPNSIVIGNVYPTSTYRIKDNKLYTQDSKQIKVFHYAEALGVKSKEEYNETIEEIKHKWFNKETMDFLEQQCNCKF